jgi:chromate transport protein ChrA
MPNEIEGLKKNPIEAGAGTAGATVAGICVTIPLFGALVPVGAALGRIGDYPAVKSFLEGAGATVSGLVLVFSKLSPLWAIFCFGAIKTLFDLFFKRQSH